MPALSAEFLATALVVVLVPGTGVLFTVCTALAQGLRAMAWAALGCTLGIVPHLVATVAGLAALLHTSALAFQLLRWAGVAYLLYVAVMTWRSARQGLALPAAGDAGQAGGASRLVLRGVLLNLLNPKLTLFFVAFLPQFVPADAAEPLAVLLALSGVFMLMTLVVFLLYGMAAQAFRRRVLQSPRVQRRLQRGFALAFAGLGLELARADLRG